MTHPDVWRDDADAAGAATLQPDTILARRYRIVQVLGESPTATVYAGEHLRLGRWDALKVPRQSLVADADAFIRYSRGARLLATLRHDHIAAVYDFSASEDGIAFLAMEYVLGKTLAQVLKAEGVLSVRRALRIAIQTAGALQAAHDAGVVHRRLRPSNIMLLGSGEAEVVKVVDFEIAAGELGSDNDSPEFMSPEQAIGEAMQGGSDVYSLALMLHRMLTGRSAFAGATKSELLVSRLTTRHLTLNQCAPGAAFPDALQAVLDAALERNPAGRTTAAAFERVLQSVFATAPASEHSAVVPLTSTVPAIQPPNRHPASTETLFSPQRIASPNFTPSHRRVSWLQETGERYRTPLAVASMAAVFALGWGGRSLMSSDVEPEFETPVAAAAASTPTVERAVTRPATTSQAVKASTDKLAPEQRPMEPVKQATPVVSTPVVGTPVAQKPEPRAETPPAADALPTIEAPAIPALTRSPDAPPAAPTGSQFRDLRTALADQLRVVQALSANGGASEAALLAMRDTAQAAWKISNTQMEKAKAAYVLASVFVHLKNREEGAKWSKLALMHCQRAVLEPTPVACEPHRKLVERFDSTRVATK
jgi:serine/threonine protein kinase